MAQFKVGERIGGEYTVLRVFGGENESGMGVVYLVRNRELPTPIVLKTFQHQDSEQAKRQFISEAHAWIKAGAHTNIVQAHWVTEIAGQLFVAAEYVEPDEQGRNNLTHFLNFDPIRLEIILLWADQFCRGMDYARSKGVLAHRDIKPDNLMIDGTATLKITDFGLAKSTHLDITPVRRGWWGFGKRQPAETVGRTKTGLAVGTLPYMAPEQFLDAKSADHRTDIYSFGIILYQMATGNEYPYPIKRDSPDIAAEFFNAHFARTPVPVESPLMPIINRCLEKKPERRYATYDAFLADLHALAKKRHIKLPQAIHFSQEDEELYAQARSYVVLGDKDRALRTINEYVSKYAGNSCGWTEKGRIHFQRGEYTDSFLATKRSLELNPYNTHAWNNLGLALNRTEASFAEVKKAFATALCFDPQNTAAMMNLIGPLILQKNFAEAATLTAMALKLLPDKPLVVAKAEALLTEFMEQRDFAAASILLAGWTTARPGDVDAWHNLGLMSLQEGNIDQAITSFKQVHLLAPDDSFAVVQLAKLYFQKKKSRECLECCNMLLQRGHQPLLAVSLKARVMNFVLGYAEALDFLQPYLDAHPNDDALWVVLAEIYEHRENYAGAIEALQHAQFVLEGSDSKHKRDNQQFIKAKLKALLETKAS